MARAFARARLGNIDPGSRRQRNGGVNASPFAPGQVLRPSSTSIAPLTAGLSRTAWAETELEETDWLRRQDSNPGSWNQTGQREGAASLAIRYIQERTVHWAEARPAGKRVEVVVYDLYRDAILTTWRDSRHEAWL